MKSLPKYVSLLWLRTNGKLFNGIQQLKYIRKMVHLRWRVGHFYLKFNIPLLHETTVDYFGENLKNKQHTIKNIRSVFSP